MNSNKFSPFKYLSSLFLGLMISIITVYLTSIAYGWTSNSKFDHTIGEAIFAERCSGCHAVSVDAVSRFGPNLARIGVDASSRIDGKNSAEYILESIVDPQSYRNAGMTDSMPQGTAAGLTEHDFKLLIGYLYSLGREFPYDVKELSGLRVDTKMFQQNRSIAKGLALSIRGEKLFYNGLGCAGCHTVSDFPDSSLMAPSLHDAGVLSQEYILDSIKYPDKVIKSGFQRVNITMKSGVEHAGNVVKESANTIEFSTRDRHGAPTLLKIDKSNTYSFSIDAKSTMPAYELSKEDESALLAFLSVFRGH